MAATCTVCELHAESTFMSACGPREHSESFPNVVGAPPPTAAVSRIRARQRPRALSGVWRASGSHEPLRGANAPSNSGGGGVPAARRKCRAPLAVKNARGD